MSKAQQVAEAIDQPRATSLDNLDNKNLICQLDNMSVVEVRGNDATPFLHGQFINDVENLVENQIQLNGYCDPKGRLIALFYLIRLADHYLMVIENTLQDNVVKRLKMFVLMADVEFSITSKACYGFIQQEDSTHPRLAVEKNSVASAEEGVMVASLSADTPRYLIIQEKKQPPDIYEGCLVCDSSVWRLFDIKSGTPSLVEKTQGCFVPQMMNLDLIDGLSFSKGCYPGQEVVARMHHLGKLKRRMTRLSIHCEEKPLPGDGIYSTDSTNNESVGKIVSTVTLADEEHEVLAVMLIKHCDDSDLYLDDGNDTKISFLKLPYAVPECET